MTKIQSLAISAPMMNRIETVYPTLLWDDNDIVLVDTAYPGQLPLLKSAFNQLGLDTDRVTRLIITHQDMDHIGCASSLKEETGGNAEVLAHPVEIPYIQGDLMLLKLTPEAVEMAVSSLPDNMPPEWKAAFRKTLENPPKVQVDTEVRNMELLPYCGGLLVLPTPGHTPGHISLYHPSSKTLIAGDALRVADGQLEFPDPAQCSDYTQAQESLRQLLNYNIVTVLCHHGGEYRGQANERIQELIQAIEEPGIRK